MTKTVRIEDIDDTLKKRQKGGRMALALATRAPPDGAGSAAARPSPPPPSPSRPGPPPAPASPSPASSGSPALRWADVAEAEDLAAGRPVVRRARVPPKAPPRPTPDLAGGSSPRGGGSAARGSGRRWAPPSATPPARPPHGGPSRAGLPPGEEAGRGSHAPSVGVVRHPPELRAATARVCGADWGSR